MAAKPQTFENHSRLVVGYHGVALTILFVNLVWRRTVAVAHFSVDAAVSLLLAVGLVLLWIYPASSRSPCRTASSAWRCGCASRACFRPTLPEEVEAFTLDQLIGLRFASDAELPSLARRVLADRITDRKAIRSWSRTGRRPPPSLRWNRPGNEETAWKDRS